MARAGAKVRVFDLDPQGDCAAFADSLREDFRVEASFCEAASLPAEAASAKEQGAAYILLDCPPTLGDQTVAALRLAQVVIVPVNAEFSAVRGLASLLETIGAAKRGGNVFLKHKILLTMFDHRSGHCHEMARECERTQGSAMLRTHIRRTYKFSDAFMAHEPILSFAPRSQGALAYSDLAREVLELFPVTSGGATSEGAARKGGDS